MVASLSDVQSVYAVKARRRLRLPAPFCFRADSPAAPKRSAPAMLKEVDSAAHRVEHDSLEHDSLVDVADFFDIVVMPMP